MPSWTDERRTDLADFFVTISDQLARLAKDSQDFTSPPTLDAVRRASNLARGEGAGFLRKPRLGIVGMFNTGKSSVVNTFLNRDVARVGRFETTPVATEFDFVDKGTEEEAEIVYTNGSVERRSVQEASDFTDIQSAIYGDDDARSEETRRSIKRVRFHLRPPGQMDFMSAFTLIDLPGFGASSDVGYAKAEESLGEVDVAILVLNPSRIGHADEVRIAKAVRARGRQLVLLLNKTDAANAELIDQSSLQRAETEIRAKFPMAASGTSGTPLVFQYSAKRVREAQLRLESLDPENSEREAAIGDLARWGLLPKREGSRIDDTWPGVLFYSKRWFSDESAEFRSRVENATRSVGAHVEEALLAAQEEQERAGRDRVSKEKELSKNKAELNEKIVGTTEAASRECLEMFSAEFARFAQRTEAELVRIVEDLLSYNVLLLTEMFRSKDGLNDHMQKAVSASRMDIYAKEVEEIVSSRTQTILRKNWGYLTHELDTFSPSVSGVPEATAEMLTYAVQRSVLALGAILGAHVLVVVGLAILTGRLSLLVWSLVSLLGFIPLAETEKTRRLRQIRGRIRTELKAKEVELRIDYLKTVAVSNAEIAAAYLTRHFPTAEAAALKALAQKEEAVQTLRAGLQVITESVQGVASDAAR